MATEARAVLQVEILDSAAAVAERGATLLADWLGARVLGQGFATLAISGGRTPLQMFARLAEMPLSWERIAIYQVDERVAPPGHEERNSVQAGRSFGALLIREAQSFHWMPVEHTNLQAAAQDYAGALQALAGSPPVLDVVHLGLGADGHTASIFPNSPLESVTPTVALTPPQQGRRRMTLTLPVLNGARRVLWTVTGRDKRTALARLIAGDSTLVASAVQRANSVLLADRDAADTADAAS
jgi:6-phosphogluconolactonase